MAEEYILTRDLINDHNERMGNLKKYYPYFKLIDNDFSQYQGGKFEQLDMGYILMAVLRFFIEENNFKEKDVTYAEYSAFMKDIYERDFELKLEKAEEQSLSSYIFDKIRNEGRPFLYSYFNPEEKKKKIARVRLIESRIKDDTVYYYLTGEAIEFYLETKEVRDESTINVSQILLSKMISSRNFKGGIEVVRRINNQVARLKIQKEEVLKLLSSDVFEGVKAYEDFMEHGVKWFAEEQKMFAKNMELIGEALKRADNEAAYSQTVRDISYLEQELKRALVNHSDLLNACTKLQIQADELVAKAKFSKLKKKFDFGAAQELLMKMDDTSLLGNFILPVLKPHVKKQFPLTSVDKMLTLRADREEKGEVLKEQKEERDYITDDEIEENRIRENYILYVRLLLYYISTREEFTIKEFNGYLIGILGEDVLNNSDYYSLMAHLAQKDHYEMEEIMNKPDTFLEEYILLVIKENPQYKNLKFDLHFLEEELQTTQYHTISNIMIRRAK
jgi:hypothetical protein